MITKSIRLNTWKENYVNIYANRGEVDSRYIEVSFVDQSQTNISLSGKSVTFYAAKPDGTHIYNNCSVNTSTNTATFELTSQALSASGVVDCEFQIFSGQNELLKVNGLKIVVSSVCDFSDSVESSSEFNVLTQAINQANEAISSATELSGSVVKGVKVNNVSLDKDSSGIVNLLTSDFNILTFERGTWVPSFVTWSGSAPTYNVTTAVGKYFRFNDLVFINFHMNTYFTSGVNQNAYIAGLPYVSIADVEQQSIAISEARGLAEDTVLSVFRDSSYIKVSELPAGNLTWNVSGSVFLSGAGCYLKA